MKTRQDWTDLIGFLAVIVIFGCLAAVISGCSPDVPIAEEPPLKVLSAKITSPGIKLPCECGCPESPCDCKSCPCKKPAVAEPAVRRYERVLDSYTVYLENRTPGRERFVPFARVKSFVPDIHNCWEWSNRYECWMVKTIDRGIILISPDQDYGVQENWKIRGTR